MRGFVLLRFWEGEIYNNTKQIIKDIKKRITIQDKELKIKESKQTGEFYSTKGKYRFKKKIKKL